MFSARRGGLRKLAAPLVVALAVVLTGSWASAQESDLPHCKGKGNRYWHNLFGAATLVMFGSKDVGEWRDGLEQEQGSVTFADGKGKYIGEYRDDKFNG